MKLPAAQPTPRAVAAMAAGAPLALALALAAPGLWLVGVGWIIAVLALFAADALLAAPAPRLTVESAHAAELGEPMALTLHREPADRVPDRLPKQLEVAVAVGPRLRPLADDRLALPAAALAAELPLLPVRRGTERVTGLWARWTGPLGLARRSTRQALDHTIRITPNLSPIRREAPLLLRTAQLGELAQRERGEGQEFEALTEWRSGMERRAIDWKRSARHRDLLAREFRTERNNRVVLAVDAGRAMSEPVDGLPRVDRAITAALLTAWMALKLGDRVSLSGFDSRPRVASGPVSGTRSFPVIQRTAAELDYSTAESNHVLALTRVAAELNRRALIVVFTEWTDRLAAEMMIRAVGAMLSRHLVLFVVLADTETQAIAEMVPQNADNVARAVAADRLSRERQLVIARLRAGGAHVLEAPADGLGPALVSTYVDFRRRGLL